MNVNNQPFITDFTVGLYVQTWKVGPYLDFIKSSTPPGESF